MRSADLYTKAILTIIAALLAWNALGRLFVPAVHAQSTSSQYAVEQLTFPTDLNSTRWDKPALETAIGRAAKGREFVTLVVPPSQGNLLAVYKEQSR